MLQLRSAPPLHADACGEMTCLPTDEAVALAEWIADVNETRAGLEGCPLVQLVPE